MKVNLYIDRLVLDGVNILPGQRHLLQVSVAAELTRMLTEGGLSPSLAQDTALARMSTGSIQLINSNSSIQLGEQIAQSLYGGIGNE